ncbi:PAS domain-containing protein [Dongia mobilis]|uniref:PAS domain-containing protein n=1 Tax=Dongia mobilis TaxID=578943 RepID=A0A4R6WPJ9_9PROT|nr:PAS domain-containing protein [Dongia mobilis]TDQ83025.1 PAS domain-containing protein [Dongia mobilis]
MAWRPKTPTHAGALSGALSRFRTPACRRLAEGYGELLAAKNGAIPGKSDLDLAGFVTAIPHLALCAITRPDRCVYRLAGEKLKQRMGFNPKGRNYYDFVPDERRKFAAEAMHMVIETPCAFRAEIRQTYSTGLFVLVEATGFPLLSAEPGVDGFIIFADQAIGSTEDLDMSVHELRGANVVLRDLIDLGAGVKEDFVDMVWAP